MPLEIGIIFPFSSLAGRITSVGPLKLECILWVATVRTILEERKLRLQQLCFNPMVKSLTDLIYSSQQCETILYHWHLRNDPYRRKSCSIQFEEFVIVTGSEDSNFGNQAVKYFADTSKEPLPLPNLREGRYGHACGSYQYEGKTVTPSE